MYLKLVLKLDSISTLNLLIKSSDMFLQRAYVIGQPIGERLKAAIQDHACRHIAISDGKNLTDKG